MKQALQLLFVCVAMAVASSTAQAAILLTMDDLPFQAVNGLSHPSGVGFGFTVGGIGSSDANYNTGGPPPQVFVQPPVIEGTTAGVLEVTLPGVFTIVQFGVAVSTGASTSVNVELFDANNISLGVQSLSLTSGGGFSEAGFVHNSGGVSRFLLDLTPAAADRFAFDNLALDGQVSAVPEPASLIMWGLGMLGTAVAARRRKLIA